MGALLSISRFRRTWDLFHPCKGLGVVLLCVLSAAAIAEAASLAMILPVLQAVLSEGEAPSAVLRYFALVSSVVPGPSLLVVVCIVAFLAIALKNVLILLRAYLSNHFVAELRRYWSCRILENSLFSQYSWLERQKQGVLLNNVVNEPNFAGKCLRDLIDLVGKAFLSVVLVIVLVMESWQIALLTAFVGALLAGMQWQASRRYSSAIGKEKIQRNQEVSGVAAESLAGARQLKIFCSEGNAVELFRRGLNRLVRLHVRIRVVQELPRTIGEIVIVGLLIGVLLYCLTIMHYDGATIIPTIGLFVVCGQRLLTNVSGFLSQRISVMSYWPSLTLVSDLARKTELREDILGGDKIDCLRDGIALRDVSFSYGQGTLLFDRLNLEFRKTQLVAIVGRSGSGKSTVCDMLMGLRLPAAGDVLVDSDRLRNLDIRSWRGLVGYVSQDTFLFNVSLRENILYGDPHAGEEDVIRAARDAGVHEFIEALPNGYDTVVGDRGVCLSGGQRQRVAIARALVRNPDLLILDEATSALDSQSEEHILALIKELRKEKVIVLVTHKVRWLSICDQIYVMENGRLVESGCYDDLMRRDGLFARLEQMSFESVEKSGVVSA